MANASLDERYSMITSICIADRVSKTCFLGDVQENGFFFLPVSGADTGIHCSHPGSFLAAPGIAACGCLYKLRRICAIENTMHIVYN